MRKGDLVEVKQGVKEPDSAEIDMSGWTGSVTEVFPPDKKGAPRTIEVNWDINTLRKLPVDFIRDSLAQGLAFSEMYLLETDLHFQKNGLADNETERQELIQQLENQHEDATYDEEGRRISAILGAKKIPVTPQHLKTYRTYLLKTLELPINVRAFEAFQWEERFLVGVGNKDEYAELRKTQPSSNDTFQLLEIQEYDELQEELIAYLERRADQMKFRIPLSYLNAVDSDKAQELQDYSSWIVNY